MREFLFTAAMIAVLSLLGAYSSPLIAHGSHAAVVHRADTLGGGPTQ
jgi:hypothetical protein